MAASKKTQVLSYILIINAFYDYYCRAKRPL